MILDFAVATPQTIFAASQTGLRVSNDGGQSWQDGLASLNLPEAPMVTAVAASPDFTEDQTVFAAVVGAVLASYDGGESWNAVLLPEPAPTVSDLVLSPNYAADGKLFLSTAEDGVFVSADRGQSWVAWNFGLYDQCVNGLAISPNFVEDQTLFAGTDSGLFSSTNGGRAWRAIGLAQDIAPITCVAFGAEGELWLGTAEQGVWFGPDELVKISTPAEAVEAFGRYGDGVFALIDGVILPIAEDGILQAEIKLGEPISAFAPVLGDRLIVGTLSDEMSIV